jgi:hypothetical protein
MGDQHVARPQGQHKCIYTSMTEVGFEPTIPVFERVKTFCASDRTADVMGSNTGKIDNYLYHNDSNYYNNQAVLNRYKTVCNTLLGISLSLSPIVCIAYLHSRRQ